MRHTLVLFILFVLIYKCNAQVTCFPCKTAVATGYQILNASDSFVLERIQKYCIILPPLYYNLCLEAMNVTYHDVVTRFENNHSPAEVCQFIGCCNKDHQTTLVHPELLSKYEFCHSQNYDIPFQSLTSDASRAECETQFTQRVCSMFTNFLLLE